LSLKKELPHSDIFFYKYKTIGLKTDYPQDYNE